MKYNYPIKYALIPITYYGNTLYVASKCYVLNEEIKYNEDGTSSMKYDVVFPYEFYYPNIVERIEPNYHKFYSVSKVFDTMEEALIELECANNKLIQDYLSSKMKRKTSKDETEKMNCFASKFKNISERLEQCSDDLVVGEIYNKQNIIRCDNKKIKISNESLYDYFEMWYSNIYFAAYHVSKEQFEQIEEQIQKGIIPKEVYGDCLLRNNPKECMTQIYDYNSNHEKGCFYIPYESFRESRFISYDENKPLLPKNENEEIIYTMESFEDFIKSYIYRLNDDEITINGKTFAKRIKLK